MPTITCRHCAGERPRDQAVVRRDHLYRVRGTREFQGIIRRGDQPQHRVGDKEPVGVSRDGRRCREGRT